MGSEDGAVAAVVRLTGVWSSVPGPARGALRRPGPALRQFGDVTLEAISGQAVWAVGEPGSGVDALGELLTGQQAPERGRVSVLDVDLARGGRAVQAVLRSSLAAIGVGGAPGLTGAKPRRRVAEVVAELAQAGGGGAQAEGLLAACGVPAERHAERIAELDPAARARVELAGAIARGARVVVVDLDRIEGLGPDVVDAVRARLGELRRAGAALVLLSGRLPEGLDDVDDRVVVLTGGRLVEVLGAGDLTQPLHPATIELATRGADVDDEAHPALMDDPGCPYRDRCVRAQDRCAAEMPPLARPLGATHLVACWFPEAVGHGLAASPDVDHEPTARDFAEG